MAMDALEEVEQDHKQCRRCKEYVSVDSAACPSCHLLFDEDEENEPFVLPEVKSRTRTMKAPKKQTSSAVSRNIRISDIRIPSGSNPVLLKGKDKASLLRWAEEVREYWLHNRNWLLKDGLCYYLQWESIFDDNEKAYEAACQIINDNLTDERPEIK